VKWRFLVIESPEADLMRCLPDQECATPHAGPHENGSYDKHDRRIISCSLAVAFQFPTETPDAKIIEGKNADL
jgi:hypothetical protein